MHWRTALKAPFDKDQFTRLVVQAWREQPDAPKVNVIAPLLLEIRPAASSNLLTLPLHGLWNALRVDHKTPPEWQVQRFLRYWFSVASIDLQLDPRDYSYITPALRAKVEVSPGSLSEPVAGDLSLEFQMERGEHRFFLNRDHLRQMHLARHALKTIAFRNLASKYGQEPVWYDHGEGVRAFGIGDTDYGSTLLANEGVWRGVRSSLRIQRVLAAVPCECHVFFTDADNTASVRRLVEKVETVYFTTTDAPLSPTIFILDYGPWRPWSPEPLKAL